MQGSRHAFDKHAALGTRHWPAIPGKATTQACACPRAASTAERTWQSQPALRACKAAPLASGIARRPSGLSPEPRDDDLHAHTHTTSQQAEPTRERQVHRPGAHVEEAAQQHQRPQAVHLAEQHLRGGNGAGCAARRGRQALDGRAGGRMGYNGRWSLCATAAGQDRRRASQGRRRAGSACSAPAARWAAAPAAACRGRRAPATAQTPSAARCRPVTRKKKNKEASAV